MEFGIDITAFTEDPILAFSFLSHRSLNKNSQWRKVYHPAEINYCFFFFGPINIKKRISLYVALKRVG
jgi:hypothetical protein